MIQLNHKRKGGTVQWADKKQAFKKAAEKRKGKKEEEIGSR